MNIRSDSLQRWYSAVRNFIDFLYSEFHTEISTGIIDTSDMKILSSSVSVDIRKTRNIFHPAKGFRGYSDSGRTALRYPRLSRWERLSTYVFWSLWSSGDFWRSQISTPRSASIRRCLECPRTGYCVLSYFYLFIHYFFVSLFLLYLSDTNGSAISMGRPSWAVYGRVMGRFFRNRSSHGLFRYPAPAHLWGKFGILANIYNFIETWQ